MLKKFGEASFFTPGTPIFVVMREGTILEGYWIEDCLGELVSLNKGIFAEADKHGFTISGKRLLPNWCEGKRKIIAGCLDKREAMALAEEARARYKPGKMRDNKPCH